MRRGIFISYSHEDIFWRDELYEHLQPLVHDKGIVIWDDRQINPGDEFREKIKKAIGSSKIAVLLVTPAYLKSEFVVERELPLLVRSRKRTKLFWIPVKDSSYQATELHQIQAAHNPNIPLDTMSTEEYRAVLASISKKIISATDSYSRTKTWAYYLNLIPFLVLTIFFVLALAYYFNVRVSFSKGVSEVLPSLWKLSIVYLVALGVYAQVAHKNNWPIPAPERFWSIFFGRLPTALGRTERNLTKPKVLLVFDQSTRAIAQRIQAQYGAHLEIEPFVCPDDFDTENLNDRLRQAEALYFFRTREIQDSERFWQILKKWEVDETHKPIFAVDFLADEYRLPYTRIPEAQAVEGVSRILAHGTDRAKIWRSQAKLYRQFWIATMVLVFALFGLLVYSVSKFQTYKILYNVYAGIARQTRDEIKSRVKATRGVEDTTMNVSYWFPYQGRYYQLGTTEDNAEQERSDFDADQNIEPTLIGCVMNAPNHSAQWDSAFSGNSRPVGPNGEADLNSPLCTFKSLANKKFQSMVCTSYSVTPGPVVGICAFTDNNRSHLSNELVSGYLRDRATEYYGVVSDQVKNETLIPQKAYRAEKHIE